MSISNHRAAQIVHVATTIFGGFARRVVSPRRKRRALNATMRIESDQKRERTLHVRRALENFAREVQKTGQRSWLKSDSYGNCHGGGHKRQCINRIDGDTVT